jgi:hypothetical protein
LFLVFLLERSEDPLLVTQQSWSQHTPFCVLDNYALSSKRIRRKTRHFPSNTIFHGQSKSSTVDSLKSLKLKRLSDHYGKNYSTSTWQIIYLQDMSPLLKLELSIGSFQFHEDLLDLIQANRGLTNLQLRGKTESLDKSTAILSTLLSSLPLQVLV